MLEKFETIIQLDAEENEQTFNGHGIVTTDINAWWKTTIVWFNYLKQMGVPEEEILNLVEQTYSR